MIMLFLLPEKIPPDSTSLDDPRNRGRARQRDREIYRPIMAGRPREHAAFMDRKPFGYNGSGRWTSRLEPHPDKRERPEESVRKNR